MKKLRWLVLAAARADYAAPVWNASGAPGSGSTAVCSATADPHLRKFVGLRCCRDRATRQPYTIRIGHQNAGFRGLTHAAMYEPARETLRRGFLGSLAARAAHLKRLPIDAVLPTAVHAEPLR